MRQMKTPAEVAAAFGCTIEQARHQYRVNAENYRKQSAKAQAKGGKVGGYTAQEWAVTAKRFERAAEQ